MLVLGRRHPQRVLRTYAAHYNGKGSTETWASRRRTRDRIRPTAGPRRTRSNPRRPGAGLSTSMNWLVESPVEVSVPFTLAKARLEVIDGEGRGGEGRARRSGLISDGARDRRSSRGLWSRRVRIEALRASQRVVSGAIAGRAPFRDHGCRG